MKRTFTIFLALVTVVALAVPALAARKDKPVKAPKVTLSIQASLWQAHEVDDLIVFTIDVVNNSGETVFVEDTLTGYGSIEPIEVADGAVLEGVELDYYVDAGDFNDQAAVTNTLIAKDGDDNVVASATAESGVTAYEECDPDGDGMFARPESYSVCIWKPAVHGDWTFEVTPAEPGKKPVTILMNLRDHVGGNWCPFDPGSVGQWRGTPATLTFELKGNPEEDFGIPRIPENWHGEAICPNGGAGGAFLSVGTPGSFYLATYDNYQVTTIPPPSTP